MTAKPKRVRTIKRPRPEPLSPEQAIKQTARAKEAHNLISQGRLPPADSADRHGEPTWTLSGVARIIGVDDAELLKAIAARPVVANPFRPASGEMTLHR